MPLFLSRRLPPIVVGACRAVRAAFPLPEAGPAPGEDVPLAEVLAGHAKVLAASVEKATPETMGRLILGEHCGD